MTRQTALHLSVKYKKIDVAKELLKSGAQVDAQDINKVTPLILACQSGFCEIAKILIENNASLKMQGEKGLTPLHCAVMKNKADIVQVLMESDKCLLNIKSSNGKTPLDLAFEKNLLDIAQKISNKMSKLLEKKEDQQKPKHQVENSNDCVICYQPKNGIFALQPCGHARTCENCSKKIIESSAPCPFCRKKAKNYQKIFL